MIDKKIKFHVVGSGMGGTSTAIRLVEMGFDVVLIDIDTPNQKDDHYFESVGVDLRHKSTLSYELGGGSNLWHGVTAPLEVEDFKQGIGITKFVTYEEMMKYWRRASNFLGFTNDDLTLEEIKSESIQSMANELPFDKSYFKPKLYKVLKKPTRMKIKLNLLESKGVLKIIKNATVKSINVDPANKSVSSIIINFGKKNYCDEIVVDNIVLCAGAINTVKILLNSKYFSEGEVFNPKYLIGKGYFDHPMGFIGKIIYNKPLSAKMYSDLAINNKEKLRLGLIPKDINTYGNTNIYFRPSTSTANSPESDRFLISLIKIKSIRDVTPKLVWMLLKNPGVLARALLNKYTLNIKYRAADIFFVSEQTYNLESKIFLGDNKDEFGFRGAKVDWRISEIDYQKIGKLFRILTKSLSKLDGIRLIDTPELDKWKQIHTSAAHHLGGIKVGDSIENSSVDQNLQFHGITNLWICDGSVLPAVGNSNPSLTIIAFSLRLADYLQKKFK